VQNTVYGNLVPSSPSLGGRGVVGFALKPNNVSHIIVGINIDLYHKVMVKSIHANEKQLIGCIP